MKRYALYFFAGLGALLTRWLMVLPLPWEFPVAWPLFLIHIIGVCCRGIFFYSIVRMTAEFAEPRWVRTLFYPFVLSTWVNGLSEIAVMYIVYYGLDHQRVFGDFYHPMLPFLNGLYYVGIVLFVVGAFFVRDKTLRPGLRIWALCFFTTGLLGGLEDLHLISRIGEWFNYVAPIIYIPPLFLNYRLWKRPPDMASEIASIGEPENPTT